MTDPTEELDSTYGFRFWCAYASNSLTMVAIGMFVRYADFVRLLGGAEGQLGLIVGVGMVGSLAMRVGQGVGIDRYGSRRIWLCSQVVFVCSVLLHLSLTTASGPWIFILRVVMQTSISGIFGASITYISRTVPPSRMAEIIGTLGTSGFVGLLIGPQLADWICRGETVQRSQIDSLFMIAAGMGTIAMVTAWNATRGHVMPPVRRHPPLWGLVRRYHPGLILLVAAALGAGVSIPNNFLRMYMAELQIGSVGLFFAIYSVTAIGVRIVTRRIFARFENRFWVLFGLSNLAISFLLYLTVHSTVGLIVPGFFGGIAHAILFPSVVATGSIAFPTRYRGLGTTLMLSMIDLGTLVGAPLIGGLLSFARLLDWPAYPLTLSTCALLTFIIGSVYWTFSSDGRPDQVDRRRARRRRK